MGHVFRRSSGRGWRLRRRSMELWPQWIEALQAHQPELRLHCGLLQIAEDEQAAERMASLAAQRADLGLQMVANSDLATVWPAARHGGLHSRQDGRVDPGRALRHDQLDQPGRDHVPVPAGKRRRDVDDPHAGAPLTPRSPTADEVAG